MEDWCEWQAMAREDIHLMIKGFSISTTQDINSVGYTLTAKLGHVNLLCTLPLPIACAILRRAFMLPVCCR